MKKVIAILVINIMLILPYAEVGFAIVNLFIIYAILKFALEACKIRWK